MHSDHTHYLCTVIIRTTCALWSYALLVHSCHTHYLCTVVIRTTCAQWSHALLVHSGHTHYLCTVIIHTTCAQWSGFSSEWEVVGGFRQVVTTQDVFVSLVVRRIRISAHYYDKPYQPLDSHLTYVPEKKSSKLAQVLYNYGCYN